MLIKIGQIIDAEHIDDKGKRNYHPFLIIDISRKYIYGLQATSVDGQDGESYFSKKNIKHYQFQNTKLPRVTHLRLDLFETVKYLDHVLATCEETEFKYICHLLLNSIPRSKKRFFSNKEVRGRILDGIKDYGQEWEWKKEKKKKRF